MNRDCLEDAFEDMDAYEYMQQSHRWAATFLPEDAPPRKPRRRQRDVVLGRNGKDGRPTHEAFQALGLLHDFDPPRAVPPHPPTRRQ